MGNYRGTARLVQNWTRLVLVAGIFMASTVVSVQATDELTARGLLRSSMRIEIRTDLAAVVTSTGFSEGMEFNKGDNLVSFDCRRQQAELNSARAAAASASIELKDKKSLRSNGAAGKSEVLLAQSIVNRTLADVAALKARMNYCSIPAPFNGRVVALNARPHEMPDANEPLLIILDDKSLELELVVPSVWLTWLKTGEKFQFKIDETRQTYFAEVLRLGAEVDPVSQTIKVIGRLNQGADDVLSGMSGIARFQSNGS